MDMNIGILLKIHMRDEYVAYSFLVCFVSKIHLREAAKSFFMITQVQVVSW